MTCDMFFFKRQFIKIMTEISVFTMIICMLFQSPLSIEDFVTLTTIVLRRYFKSISFSVTIIDFLVLVTKDGALLFEISYYSFPHMCIARMDRILSFLRNNSYDLSGSLAQISHY